MTRDQRCSVDLTKPPTLRVAEPGAIPRQHVTAPHPRDGLVPSVWPLSSSRLHQVGSFVTAVARIVTKSSVS